MADNQKVVAARIQATSLSATLQPSLQPQGPRFGNVIADGGEGSEIRTILWDNGLVQDVEGASVADLNLDVIEDADEDTVDAFEGTVVVRIAPGGPVAGDPAGGTSRQYAAAVLAVYKRTPLEDTPGTGDDFLLAYDLSNGAYYEDLAEHFVVLGNR